MTLAEIDLPVVSLTGATVLKPGIQTTVQDARGRVGMWDVGVPPSGAFDDLSFTLANQAVGNNINAAGLECVVIGPTLQFQQDTVVCVTGAVPSATIDGAPITPGLPVPVAAGAILAMGKISGPGMRGYLAVAGGLDTPVTLGSSSTFVLGKFGGLHGRALAKGDVLAVGTPTGPSRDVRTQLPEMAGTWSVRVILGPHGAPEYLTPSGSEALFATEWTVDHRSDRTGIRLSGAAPEFARTDGGEAGLHPSNVHDSAYPVGGVMLSGDTPVIVGPDGPSLGGFVVPCVVIETDRWMLGQFRPGDTVRLVPVTPEESAAARADRMRIIRGETSCAAARLPARPTTMPVALCGSSEVGAAPAYTIRRAGDRHVLLQAGPAELDLTVRMWIHLVAENLRAAGTSGIVEIVEGVRSLLVGFDDTTLSATSVTGLLADSVILTDDPATVTLDVREVSLPIAFDHPLAHEAMIRYQTGVRPDAPWCPDNVEFIRRVNDLPDRLDVFDTVSAATYLVIGLGDVYLGAPLAVPLDPRHRLVTTKYDPARTWTPQNAVGIGGIYLCVYGMEGPGGYQLVGRTVPVWRLLTGADGQPRDQKPWLLRPFDRIRFNPVTVAELEDTRADIISGRADLVTRPATFSVAEVHRLEAANAAEIHQIREQRVRAFAAERTRWGR